MKIADKTAILGENISCVFLEKQKFKIIERNYRKSYTEIDIIAIDNSNPKERVLSFIEVKTRKTDIFGSPLEAITPWKIKNIVRTGQYYKMTHGNLPESIRIDAVSVILLSDDKVKEIELIKDISGF